MAINKNNSLLSTATELRSQAEERLRAQTAEFQLPRNKEEALRLVHELEVHQIELEMQNDELIKARNEVGVALDKYTDLYDFAPIGYFTLDDAGTILAANLSAATLLGIERSNLLGKRFGLFVPVNDRPFFAEFLEKVFAGQSKKSCEVTITGENGRVIFLQIEAVAYTSVKECRVAIIDITERRKVEEERELLSTALQKSEKKFSVIFNYVPTLISIFTWKEHRYIDVNQAWLQTLGYRREEIIGKTAQELNLWENEANRVRVMQTIQEQRSIRDLEIRFKGKNDQILTGLFSAEIVDIDGKQHILSVVRDITKRKSAEDEVERLNKRLAEHAADLEDANRELEAFNYTVAHDLRNPLNIICSYCQAIKDVCSDKLGMTCRRYVQETYDGAMRMNRLIEALLNFSQLTHAAMKRETVDFSRMAKEAAEELEMTAGERRVEIRIADGISASGDANLLRVVLNNLFGNAWKYTGIREEAVIEFGVMDIDSKPAYFVRDNGTGFDNTDRDKLFIPFQRFSGSEECRGFGIGLATVERIIKRHGGRVWAEGEPGMGAAFYFTLEA